MELKGKKALVTGGGVGIGRATALALAAAGCHVAVNYSRSREDCEATAAEIEGLGVKSLAVKADVGNDEQVRAMVAETVEVLGGLDVLVNNAGVTCFVPHEDLEGVSEEDWERIFDTNVRGTFYCTRAAADALKAGEGGAVVNLSSVAGVYGMGSSIPYCASKAAINSLTVTTSRVMAPEVRVNAVAPGFVDTRWWKDREHYDVIKQMAAEATPLKRVAGPDDVAQTIMGLLRADMVTGDIVVMDGGMGQAHG